MLLPALSRAEPEFFIRKGQAKPEGCYPLGLLRFRWKTNRHLDLRKRFPYPAASPSLRRAFPLVVWEAFPYLNVGRHSSNSPLGAPGLFWFEHRLKHDWRGPSYAMRSIQKSLWEAAGMTKRGRFPVLHWKKDLREERLLLGFFLPRPPPPGPR